MFGTAKDTKPTAAKDGMINESGPAVDDMKETVRQFKGEARDAAASIGEDLEGVARRTGHHMRELADSAGYSFSEILQTATRKIRSKPVQSTAIAAGVGLIIGLIYRRR